MKRPSRPGGSLAQQVNASLPSGSSLNLEVSYVLASYTTISNLLSHIQLGLEVIAGGPGSGTMYCCLIEIFTMLNVTDPPFTSISHLEGQWRH